MARQLAGRGDAVALAARRLPRLEALAGEVESSPGRVSVHALDVTDAAAVASTMRSADELHGGIDVVVVNAGRGGGGRIGTGRSAENRSVVETNFLGALAQCEAALEIFRARDRGHLVLVSSMAGSRGFPGSAAIYSATKAAVTSLGESLRIEFSGTDIAVTTLRPGYIKTEINEGATFPYLTSTRRGVESMIRAIDRRAGDAVVPYWPWGPAHWLLRIAPGALIRRFM